MATIDNVHNVAKNLAYELAHQWFGGLVTIKQGTDGWLSEAVSTYFAAHGVASVSSLAVYIMQMLNRCIMTTRLIYSAVSRMEFFRGERCRRLLGGYGSGLT